MNASEHQNHQKKRKSTSQKKQDKDEEEEEEESDDWAKDRAWSQVFFYSVPNSPKTQKLFLIFATQ